MKLYFQRHGLADWPNWKKPDGERPLTTEGSERLQAQAKALSQLSLAVDLILSSPLVRARQTADILAEQLSASVTVALALAPGFSLRDLSILLKGQSQAQALMLVGHEPDFSTCISALLGGGRIALKKGGLARVDLDSLEPPLGQLIWLLAPKILTLEL